MSKPIPTRQQQDQIIQALRETAAAEVMPRFRSLDADQVAAKTSPYDLVTLADKAMEVAMRARLADILPHAEFLGEEMVEGGTEAPPDIDKAETCIILDPIDGTLNFVRGLSTFGSILAITNKGETVFAVIYDPVNDDWISAVRAPNGEAGNEENGHVHFQTGVRLDAGLPPRPLPRLSATPLAEADGNLPLYLYPAEDRPALFQRFHDTFGRLVWLHCSAHQYRLIATGYLKFEASGVVKPWDHAAGAMIIQQLGGIAETAPGVPYKPSFKGAPLVVATDRALADAIWERLP